jgi:hypothetical protein
MDRQYTPKEFMTLFNTHHADRQVREMFRSEFGDVKGSSMGIAACGKGGQSCSTKLVR